MKTTARWHSAAALALLPMACALAGACVDERLRLGFSTWRAACRASGPALSSLLTFTLELMPTAVLGALAGGLAVQLHGVLRCHRRGAVESSLAAHAGCASAMVAGLLLCISSLPLAWVLAAEASLAAFIAAALFRRLERRHFIQVELTLA